MTTRVTGVIFSEEIDQTLSTGQSRIFYLGDDYLGKRIDVRLLDGGENLTWELSDGNPSIEIDGQLPVIARGDSIGEGRSIKFKNPQNPNFIEASYTRGVERR